MEPDKSFSDSPNQTALQQAELVALLRMLSISKGTFSLSLAICNSPALREYLIGKVEEQRADIENIQIGKDCTDLLAFTEGKLTTKRPSAIFITEIEQALPSDDKQPKIIRNLNASRELWQQKFSCPVVFWLAEYAATTLQKEALDFASWISHIFEFVSEQATAVAGTTDAYAGDITSASRLDTDQKRFRIAELEQRIDEAGDPPEAQLVQHVLTWLNELSYIYKTIGELDRAQRNITKLLEIAEKLGLQARMASGYGNLGLIYSGRGDLDQAEQMFRKALEIDEELGREAKMANSYGNLGMVYRVRGDLDRAEQMLNKALEIHERLKRQYEMAVGYANLGVLYEVRGDLGQAEQMYRKALDIDEKLGRLDGMAIQYSYLGAIYHVRGDLDQAEQMFGKALEIDEKLGRLDGMAIQRANLGRICQTRGDLEEAGEYWEKALVLFKKIGMKPEIEKVQGWIHGLDEQVKSKEEKGKK